MAGYTKCLRTRRIVGMGVVLWVGVSLANVSEAENLTKVLGQGMSVKAYEFNPNVADAIAPGIAAGISQAVTQEFPQAAVWHGERNPQAACLKWAWFSSSDLSWWKACCR